MAKRRIPLNSQNITGNSFSKKSLEYSAFESSLERDFIDLIEFDKEIYAFESQPIEIPYTTSNGQQKLYYPDFLVIGYHNELDDLQNDQDFSRTLFEVKYRNDLFENWKELKPKFKAARAFAKSKGWKFKLITDKEIRTPYLNNVKFLKGYKKEPLYDERKYLLLENLRSLRETDPETLVVATNKDKWNQAKLIYILWQMVAYGIIGTDLTLPLTMASRIWINEEID